VSSELLTADLSNFAQFGISSELLAAAGVRRVGDAEARDEFGIRLPASSDLSGLVFPYLNPRTLKRVTVRLRRDRPEIDTDGRLLNKYVSACGDRRHLYFAPGAIEFLGHTEIPVVLVEAEKSSLALTAWGKRNGHSILAVGCGGCWGWRGRVGKVIAIDGSHVDEKGPLADLDLINWEDRDVVICFDSNAACNPNVRRARRDLAHELSARRASVRIANLPNEKGVNGPDDYLACLGDAAITELLDSARLFGEAAGAQLCQILQSLESGSASVMTPDAQQATFDLLADIEDPEQRRILVSRVTKALGHAKSDVKAAVQSRITRSGEQSRLARERTRVVRLQNVDVRPAALVGELESFFAERLYLPPDCALLLAIWVMNTWTFETFDTTPYLLIESATPQCGKTTLFSLLEAVGREPLQVADMTPAAMFRVIEARKPTILIDEAESLVGKSEKADAIRAIANAGYKRGAKVFRTVGERADLQVKEFETFGPKAFACIGGLKGPLLSRCIVITMSKRPPGVRLQSSRIRVLRRVAQPLREQLEAYGVQSRKRLATLYEAEPDEGYWTQLPDREGELWGPLLLHARLAGPEVEGRALGTATALSGRKKSSTGTELLSGQRVARGAPGLTQRKVLPR
jgi:hypothetical protein